MKNRFVAVFALVLLAFASMSMAAENLPQNEVDEIIKGVENGDADAQFRLGMMYFVGQNVKQDSEQAVYWLKNLPSRAMLKPSFCSLSCISTVKEALKETKRRLSN